MRFTVARILQNSGIAKTAYNCGCEFRPRQFHSVSAEPRLKNTVLGDSSTGGLYCVTVTYHESSKVYFKLQ